MSSDSDLSSTATERAGEDPADPAAADRPPPRPSVVAGYLALGLSGLLIAAASFQGLLPWPEDGALEPRRKVFTEAKDAYDIVLVGTSRTGHGVIPEIVEEALAARGLELRVFNLAADEMGSYEVDYVLRHLLAMRPARLRYVLIELGGWGALLPAQETEFTARDVHWHDWRQTGRLLADVWSRSALSAAARWELMKEHAGLFLVRQFSIGRGGWWVREALARERLPGDATPEQIRQRGGYLPWSKGYQPRHQNFLERQERYRKRLAQLATATPQASDQRHVDTDALRAQVELAREAGVLPIHFVGPAIHVMPYVQPLAESGLLPVVLDFHDPRKYPDFYEPAQRFDDDHLNHRGAVAFSRVLGAELARVIHAHGGESP